MAQVLHTQNSYQKHSLAKIMPSQIGIGIALAKMMPK